VWLILRQVARLGIIGGAIGFALGVVCSRLLRSLLIDRSPAVDPLAFGAAAFVLTAVMPAAAAVPAGRGTRMDPMRALRSE
jgi:ABC-type antimicrobial peptide transport system permease subunit